MKTSVIGYPRIGAHRELKFASEKYFAKKIELSELEATAKEMRLSNWKSQKEAGIDLKEVVQIFMDSRAVAAFQVEQSAPVIDFAASSTVL